MVTKLFRMLLPILIGIARKKIQGIKKRVRISIPNIRNKRVETIRKVPK